MRALSTGFAIAILCAARAASAHVSISSGPAAANKTQIVTFSVGHGCEGLDTYRVRVEIPAGVSSVRPLRSDFGRPTVDTDGSNVIAVEWQKSLDDLQETDVGYYEIKLRMRVADLPFTTIPFTVHQICRNLAGDETEVLWTGETAATLVVVPPRSTGWNSYTLAAPIAEANVPTYFGDAQILWRGTAAYSSNPVVAVAIAATSGVTMLTGDLAAGDQVWVKY